MRATGNALLIAALAVLVPSQILADDFYIYPAKGQSKEQQGKDKYQCYDWAKQQTGFDPMSPPTQPPMICENRPAPPPASPGRPAAGESQYRARPPPPRCAATSPGFGDLPRGPVAI